MNAYSALKPLWHTDMVDGLREGRLVQPKHIHLILSDLCNHDCHFCAYRTESGFTTEQFWELTESGAVNRNPNRMIPVDKAKEIIDDAARLGVQAIQFTGGGEPTVHPNHLELFERVLGSGMKAALVTNGALLREGWEDVLPRFSWVRVSVDAGSPEVYARVRNVSPNAYERTLRNVESMARAIDEAGTDCLLGVGYVVTRKNWKDLLAGVNRLRDTGAAYVRLTAMFSRELNGHYRGIEKDISDLISRCKESETDDFKVVDLFGMRESDMEQQAPDYSFCGYQFYTVYIGGNLKVYRCCATAYTRHGEVGNLSGMSLYDWATNAGRLEKYYEFDARTCSVCQFNHQNRAIDYATSGTATHVEFV